MKHHYAYSFPAVPTFESWSKIFDDFSIWKPAAEHIIDKSDLPCGVIEAVSGGTCAIVRVEADQPYFLKLFPPLLDRDFIRECAVYGILIHNDKVPRLLQSDREGDWGWIALTEIAGKALRSYSQTTEINCFLDLGRLMRDFHNTLVPSSASISQERWIDFVSIRTSIIIQTLRKEGFDDLSLELEKAFGEYRQQKHHVVLTHADLTQDHIFVSQDGALTGLIDFADARMADPAYEMPALWLDGCDRNYTKLQAFLEGYGADRILYQSRSHCFLMATLNPFIFRDLIMPFIRQQRPCLTVLEEFFWREMPVT